MTAGELLAAIAEDPTYLGEVNLSIDVASGRALFGRLLSITGWDGLVQIELEQGAYRHRPTVHLLAPFDMVEVLEDDWWL